MRGTRCSARGVLMGYWIAVTEEDDGKISVQLWVRFRGSPMLAARFLGPPSLIDDVRAFAPRVIAAVLKRANNGVSGTFSIGRH
jgi:hypothetical protein